MKWKQSGFRGLGEYAIAPAFSECAMKWFPIREFLQGTIWPYVLCSFFMETVYCKDGGLVSLPGQKHHSLLQSKGRMKEWVLWWGFCFFSVGRQGEDMQCRRNGDGQSPLCACVL